MKQKLTNSSQWQALADHYEKIRSTSITKLFKEDPNRGKKFMIQEEDIYFDYSKNLVNVETIRLLLGLTQTVELKREIEAMVRGDKINITENRSVLHTALRDFSADPVYVNGEDIKPVVKQTLEKMRAIAEKIRKEEWSGFSGRKIRNIINIGIGGSDLGPRMAAQALNSYSDQNINLYFVSNLDAADICQVLEHLNPEETLFIVSSKTFTTMETLTNAYTARSWLLDNCSSKDLFRHFLAVTSNRQKAREFGIAESNILEFRDWVGGRYSLTSAIGISLMISLGYKNFIQLLKGFNSMDSHFQNRDFAENIPVLMALLGIWYNNFFNYQSLAVIPYSQSLALFPAYLQQTDMESNGKATDRQGNPVTYQTGPVIWGEPGSNSQHAFFQLIHQGTRIIPCDFIGYVNPLYRTGDHHQKLTANLFAQSRALGFGKSARELTGEGVDPNLLPFRMMPGNRPSNTILINKLTPFSLGRLIAMYEHKIFVQGIIWNIFSFDQWGVELGKNIARKIISGLAGEKPFDSGYDSSTQGLISHYKKVNETG